MKCSVCDCFVDLFPDSPFDLHPEVFVVGGTQAPEPAKVDAVPAAADALCECCDLPWYSCGKQLERQQHDQERAERERAMHLPGVIASRHPGKCVTCDERFDKDTPIRKREGGWQNVLCCGLADL